MSEEEKKQRARERSKKYYQKNKEKVLARQKAYVKKKYASDSEYREKIKKRNSKYALNNLEKVRELKRKWAIKHYKELRDKGLLPPSKKEVIETQKKEIERLNKEILGLNNCITEFHSEFCYKQAEINRINNIINELEKWLNEERDATIFDYNNAIEDVIDKLIELKGSDK